ncbi:hypothetical protein Tco_0785424, partial [Tanacetum coccineum]
VLDGSHDDAPVAKDGEVATVDATLNPSRIWKRKTKRAKKKKKEQRMVCGVTNRMEGVLDTYEKIKGMEKVNVVRVSLIEPKVETEHPLPP